MKKLLIASTALVAAAAAGAASAAERPTATVGGYMLFGLGLTDAQSPSQTTDLSVFRDGEIHIKFSGSSDNGLTFAGRVEIEGHTQSDQIDENWASVSGSFGTFMVGSNDTAAYNLHVGDVGGTYYRIAYYDGFSDANPGMLGPVGSGGDPLGVFYTSPTIAGFTVAGSYHPNIGCDGGNQIAVNTSFDTQICTRTTKPNRPDLWDVAAKYETDFSGFGVAATVGYFGSSQDVTLSTRPGFVGPNKKFDAFNALQVGLEFTYSGFTLTGSFQDNQAADSQDYTIGGVYATGPWEVGGGWAHRATSNNAKAYWAQEDTNAWAAWARYALAPGVVATAGVEGADANTSTYNALAYMLVAF